MKDTIVPKFKHYLKSLTGKFVYLYTYYLLKIKKFFNEHKNDFKLSKLKTNKKKALKSLFNHWKKSALVLGLILCTYYGIGALISSKINKQLNNEIPFKETSVSHTNEALIQIIKSQIDEQAWTPALPLIFPASILDNLPNFQKGVKESAALLIKAQAQYTKDETLLKASSFLEYPDNIWLFSQTKKNSFAPGSAKQYRNALSELAKFNPDKQIYFSAFNFLNLLKEIDTIISQQLSIIEKQILEHYDDMLDTKSDNIFYNTQGKVYTIHYVLKALAEDFSTLLIDTNQYEHLTSALKYLANAEALSPLNIKNASLNDIYTANHLAYLGYYLARAQNEIEKIYNSITRIMELSKHEN